MISLMNTYLCKILWKFRFSFFNFKHYISPFLSCALSLSLSLSLYCLSIINRVSNVKITSFSHLMMEWLVAYIINMKNNPWWHDSVCICIRPVFPKKRKVHMCAYLESAGEVKKWRPRGTRFKASGARIQTQSLHLVGYSGYLTTAALCL